MLVHPTDTTILQTAIDSIVEHDQPGPIELEPREYLLEDSLHEVDSEGVEIWGKGWGHKNPYMLTWNGPDDRPMFDLENPRFCRFGRFSVDMRKPLLSVFRSRSLGSTDRNAPPEERRQVPSNLSWEYMAINGREGKLGKGFHFPKDRDWNNDLMSYEQVHVAGMREAAWSIEHQQSKHHLWERCGATGMKGPGPDPWAIGPADGISGLLSGEIRGFSCGFLRNVLNLDRGPNDGIVASTINAEVCGRLIKTASVGAGGRVTVRDSRFGTWHKEVDTEGPDVIRWSWGGGGLLVEQVSFRGVRDAGPIYFRHQGWESGPAWAKYVGVTTDCVNDPFVFNAHCGYAIEGWRRGPAPWKLMPAKRVGSICFN